MLEKHCCGYLNQDVFFKKELTHSLKIVSAVRRLIFNRVEIFNSNIGENVQYLRFGKGCGASSIFYSHFYNGGRYYSPIDAYGNSLLKIAFGYFCILCCIRKFEWHCYFVLFRMIK